MMRDCQFRGNYHCGAWFKKGLIAALCVWLTGCASITQGTTQKITITPKQACVAKTQEGIELGATDKSGSIQVRKSKDALVIECVGKQPKTIESKVSKVAAVGAVLLDGGVIDMLTGAMWMYESTIEVSE
jgi:hypothetical protein